MSDFENMGKSGIYRSTPGLAWPVKLCGWGKARRGGGESDHYTLQPKQRMVGSMIAMGAAIRCRPNVFRMTRLQTLKTDMLQSAAIA